MASPVRRGSVHSGGRDPVLTAAFAGAGVFILLLAVIAIEMFLMLQQMHQLGSSLPNTGPSVDRLEAIRSDLDRMQGDLHQVDLHMSQVQNNTTDLDSALRDLVARVAALDKDLAQIDADLKDVDRHVAAIDRKTGPAPPPPLP